MIACTLAKDSGVSASSIDWALASATVKPRTFSMEGLT